MEGEAEIDKETEGSLEGVCSELDSMSIQMLCLMKEYIECKVNIEDLIKSGSLHLAKSRYIMGNRSVSSLQLPTEESDDISAKMKVLQTEKKSSSVENITLELSKMSVEKEAQKDEGLKSRAKGTEKDESNASPESGKSQSQQDPLKWFGVLVPQNLRHAQSYFVKAIDYVVQCANVQLEMSATQKRFKQYMARKKKLLESPVKDKE